MPGLTKSPPADVVDDFLQARTSLYRVALVGTRLHVKLPFTHKWTANYTNRALTQGAVVAAITNVYGVQPASNIGQVWDKFAGVGVKYVPRVSDTRDESAIHLVIIDEAAMTKMLELINISPQSMSESWRKKFAEAKMLEFALGSARKSFDSLAPHFSTRRLAALKLTVELVRVLLEEELEQMIEAAKTDPSAASWRRAVKRDPDLFRGQRAPTLDDFDAAPLSQWADTVLSLAAATRTTINDRIKRDRKEAERRWQNAILRPHAIEVDNAAGFIVKVFDPTTDMRLPHGWTVRGGQRLTKAKNEAIFLLTASAEATTQSARAAAISRCVVYQNLSTRKFYEQSHIGFDHELLYGVYTAAGQNHAAQCR